LKNCSKIETKTLPKLDEIIKEKLNSKEILMIESTKLKEKLKNLRDKDMVRIKNEYKEEVLKLNSLKKSADSKFDLVLFIKFLN
jgi:hypothetical protein